MVGQIAISSGSIRINFQAMVYQYVHLQLPQRHGATVLTCLFFWPDAGRRLVQEIIIGDLEERLRASIIDPSQQAVRIKILYVCLVGGERRGERR